MICFGQLLPLAFLCRVNQQLAHSLLELDSATAADPAAVVDAVSNKVFALKDFGLRNPVVGQLFLNRVRQLVRLHEAGLALVPAFDDWVTTSGAPVPTVLQDAHAHAGKLIADGAPLEQIFTATASALPLDLLAGLRAYEQRLSRARLGLASAQHPATAAAAMLLMISIQNTYHQWLMQHVGLVLDAVDTTDATLVNSAVKSREQVDSAVLIGLAVAAALPENSGASGTRQWLQNAIAEQRPNEAAPFLTECYRIRLVQGLEQKALSRHN